MKTANIHQAKTQLSKLIDLALAGEEVIICKSGKPVVKLTAIIEKKEIRKSGQWQGKIEIKEDFDELPADFLSHFSKK